MDRAALAELVGKMPGYSAQTTTAEVVAWLKGEITVQAPERMVNARTVLSEYPGGPMDAAAVLEKLEGAAQSVPAVKWVLSFLKADGGIDISDSATRSAIDALVTGGALTSEEGERLKALGESSLTRWASVGGSPNDEDGYIAQVVDGVRGWV